MKGSKNLRYNSFRKRITDFFPEIKINETFFSWEFIKRDRDNINCAALKDANDSINENSLQSIYKIQRWFKM